MEWEKAKTILIVVFILLNAGLFVMNAAVTNSYKLTQDEISVVTELLSKNGITLMREIPASGKPHRLLTLSAPSWDYDYIKSTFFPNAQQVTRTNEVGNVIYRAEDGATVTIVNAATSDTELIFYEPVGVKTADGYVRQLGKPFESFELKREIPDENGGAYLYNETLKGDAIFASEVKIEFLSGGGVLVSIKKYDFVSYVEGYHDIFRTDEALMTFIHYKSENISGSVTIEDIQLGYFIDSQTSELTRKSKPCYRIFINGESEPVFIDALMNTVI